MIVYHFADPDLRVETFFEKDETAENGGLDFEIRDIDTSAHLKFHRELVCFVIAFFGDKKVAFKSSLDLYFHPSIIEFKSKEKIRTKAVADVSRYNGGRVFLFF